MSRGHAIFGENTVDIFLTLSSLEGNCRAEKAKEKFILRYIVEKGCGKEPAFQSRIPWRRKWQPTRGQKELHRVKHD